MGTVGEAVPCDKSHFHEKVPDWLTLYVFLGLADLGFTLAAFQLGAIEANPFLDHSRDQGLFEFCKISLTLLIMCIAYKLRNHKIIPKIMAIANAFMSTLVVYHVTLLSLVQF